MLIIQKIFKKLDIVFEWAAAFILGSMTLLIFIQVIFRKVFVQPLAWSEELAQLLFIWMTFVAGYVAARRGQHIGVELIQDLCPPKAKRIMQFFANIIAGGFFGTVFYYCVTLWSKLLLQSTPALKVPMAFVYLGMMIGCLFMSAWYIFYAFTFLFPKKEEGTT